MRGKSFGGLAIAIALLAGCQLPLTSGENTLPDLVAVTGAVSLPDTDPAPDWPLLRVELASLDGQLLAAGRLLGPDRFALRVPQNLLSPTRAQYRVDLRDDGGRALLRALVPATRNGPESSVSLDDASTAVALAATAYRQAGGDPTSWDPRQLAGLPAATEAARLYRYAASRSEATASQDPGLPAATLQRLISAALSR